MGSRKELHPQRKLRNVMREKSRESQRSSGHPHCLTYLLIIEDIERLVIEPFQWEFRIAKSCASRRSLWTSTNAFLAAISTNVERFNPAPSISCSKSSGRNTEAFTAIFPIILHRTVRSIPAPTLPQSLIFCCKLPRYLLRHIGAGTAELCAGAFL